MVSTVVLASLFTAVAYAARLVERQADVHVSDFIPAHAVGRSMPIANEVPALTVPRSSLHAMPSVGTRTRFFPSMAMQSEGEDSSLFADEPWSLDAVASVVEPVTDTEAEDPNVEDRRKFPEEPNTVTDSENKAITDIEAEEPNVQDRKTFPEEPNTATDPENSTLQEDAQKNSEDTQEQVSISTAALASDTASDTATAAARAALLDVIAPLKRGFRAKREQQKAVAARIDELAKLAPQKGIPDLSGDWELIYTDAPDILALDIQAGPFLTCTRIGQQISEADGTIANVIEYGPRNWGSSLVAQIKGDRLQQRVITSFTRDPYEPTTVDLKIRGAAFIAKQAFGISLESLPPLTLQGVVEPPFGSFEVLYCEGPEGPPASVLDPYMEFDRRASIRIVRTQQGYYSINRRISGSDGWGEA